MTYGIQFDFDEMGEPPIVYIAEDGGLGTVVVEVMEEPTGVEVYGCAWKAGPLATRLVEFMNAMPPLEQTR